MLPLLLPWLAALLLLMLGYNRTPAAWWVWAPLGCVVAGEFAVQHALMSMPSEARDTLCDMADALAFGIAGAWLLAPFIAHRRRFLTFLRMLLAIVLFSTATCVVRQD